MSTSLRADKWLWATRFYKTRSQATQACEGGKVKREGLAIKPATALKIGDRLTIPASEAQYLRQVQVLELPSKRTSPPLARSAYEETTAPEVVESARKAAREARIFHIDGDQGRFTKKKRRDWEKIKGGFFD